MTGPRAHDLVVIGGGPAGMAAATRAASLGLKTVLLDEQPEPGGQIHRGVAHAPPAVSRLLGPDYTAGRRLVQALEASGAERQPGALVWDLARDLTVTVLQQGRVRQFRAPQVVAATGALERPSPLPGWTLPGVMNAGAAQIALKAGGSVPSGRVVLAGTGPLLLLVAVQLLDAGVEVAALVETGPSANVRRAWPHGASALVAWPVLAKGLALLTRLRRAGVPWYRRASGLQVRGRDRAEGLAFSAGGRTVDVPADTVLLHHGVIPNTQLSRLMRVAHRWSDEQLAWQVQTDAWGETSMPGLRMAGDGVAIAGARAAEAAGALAALGAAHALGRIDDAQRAALAARWQQRLATERRIRPFLDALYRPPPAITHPADDVVVCRCEEVTAGRIREMARLGCQGPNQTKFFSRCGMGPCQGRVCAGVVTQLLAAAHGQPEDAVGAYRIRAPLKPLALGALATLVEPPAGPDPGPLSPP